MLRRQGIAWLGLVTALGIHVTDEALTGFLPFFNAILDGVRESFPSLPVPTFTFAYWLGGLIGVVGLLYLMSPLVFAGRKSLRYVSYVFSILMILNGLVHFGASLYRGFAAPGVYSSPILVAAAIALMMTTIQAGSTGGNEP